MSEKDVSRAKAEELVKVSAHGRHLSTDERQTIVEALTDDLHAAVEAAAGDEERLAKVETQTRVLAEAVIAITDTGPAIAPAVQAVKDKM